MTFPPRSNLLFVLYLAVSITGLSACGGGADTETGQADTTVTTDTAGVAVEQTIVDVLRSDNRFSMFVAALDSAGMADVFEDEGPYTVFVPTNQAFGGTGPSLLAPESRDRLRDVLMYHAVQEQLTMDDLRTQGSVTTLQGDDLRVTPADSLQPGGELTISGAAVTDPNVLTRNGKIYVINTLLMPPSAADTTQ
jgi:uncharacterized surface protein with fasciclin (FAS1) repeats